MLRRRRLLLQRPSPSNHHENPTTTNPSHFTPAGRRMASTSNEITSSTETINHSNTPAKNKSSLVTRGRRRGRRLSDGDDVVPPEQQHHHHHHDHHHLQQPERPSSALPPFSEVLNHHYQQNSRFRRFSDIHPPFNNTERNIQSPDRIAIGSTTRRQRRKFLQQQYEMVANEIEAIIHDFDILNQDIDVSSTSSVLGSYSSPQQEQEQEQHRRRRRRRSLPSSNDGTNSNRRSHRRPSAMDLAGTFLDSATILGPRSRRRNSTSSSSTTNHRHHHHHYHRPWLAAYSSTALDNHGSNQLIHSSDVNLQNDDEEVEEDAYSGLDINDYTLFGGDLNRNRGGGGGGRRCFTSTGDSISPHGIIYAKEYPIAFTPLMMFLVATFFFLLMVRIIVALLTMTMGMLVVGIAMITLMDFLRHPITNLHKWFTITHATPVLVWAIVGGLVGALRVMYVQGRHDEASVVWGLLEGTVYGMEIGAVWLVILGDASDSTQTALWLLQRGEQLYGYYCRTFRISVNGSTDSRYCMICLEPFSTSSHNYQIPKRLPCCHEFHSECVDQWFTVKPTCPICRVPIEEST